MEHAVVVLVSLAVPHWPERLRGRSGYLVPKPVQDRVTAASFGSQKWAHWRGGAGEIVRVSLGRDGRSPDDLDDDAVVRHAVDELGRHTGVDVQPTAVRISRWPGAFPQYRPHHRDWLARVDAARPAGLVLTGASYDGIGIPACIDQGRRAAAAVAAHVDVVMGEGAPVGRLCQTVAMRRLAHLLGAGALALAVHVVRRRRPHRDAGRRRRAEPRAPRRVVAAAPPDARRLDRRRPPPRTTTTTHRHARADDAADRRRPRSPPTLPTPVPPPPEDGSTEETCEVGTIEIPSDRPVRHRCTRASACRRSTAGPGTGPGRPCRASSATSSSPATARATTPSSATSTTSSPATRSSCTPLAGRFVYRVVVDGDRARPTRCGSSTRRRLAPRRSSPATRRDRSASASSCTWSSSRA